MVAESGFIFDAIRSDRGTETPMMANAHWQLHQQLNPDIPFHHVYWYGTSTLNQKIESWWRQMSKSQTLFWKNYLDDLTTHGAFTGTIADQIALLYVFLPILRKQVYHYVDLWNAHSIRVQPRRPYLPTGKPIVLYHCPPPGVQTFGQDVDEDYLMSLRQEVSAWGKLYLSVCFELC